MEHGARGELLDLGNKWDGKEFFAYYENIQIMAAIKTNRTNKEI
jgi:hypothetical protein